MTDTRYAAALGGPTRWATKVDWSNDGGTTWTPATFAGGSVTCSSTSQVRWVSQIKLLDAPFGLAGINPYQSRYRIRHGMRFSSHEEPRWLGLGVYCVTTVARSTSSRNQLDITGESFETYLMRSAFTTPRTFEPTDAAGLLGRLIREVLPSAAIDWRPSVTNVSLPRVTVDRDRWAMIDGSGDAASIAKSVGARVYPNGDGVWTVAPVPTLQDEPAWEAYQGRGGVLLTVGETLSNENVQNVQIVFGSPEGGQVVGPGIAKDYDPLSLTYVLRNPDRGGFGEVPGDPYTSQLITSLDQANRVAAARLASRLGLKQQLTFDTLHDPTKEPGQVGIIHGFDPQRAILDAVTYDLVPAPGPLKCQSRTTATRLVGGPGTLLADG